MNVVPLRLVGRMLLGMAMVLGGSSCDGPFGIDEDVRLGVIAFHGDPVVVTAPDTVQVGQPFSVSVRTYGDGCVSQDGTKVKSDGLSVDVRPYDIHSGAKVCNDILNMFHHTATVTLHEVGTAEIEFHGLEAPENRRISETREVVVR